MCCKMHVNVFHLIHLLCLVKLEMLIAHVLPMSCYRKKLHNLSYLNCSLQIHQIYIQLITAWGTNAREGVRNRPKHHWSGRTETATENGVGQAGSRCHCSSHSSLASSIAPDMVHAPDQWLSVFLRRRIAEVTERRVHERFPKNVHRDACCVNFLLQYFPHVDINWIQIWRIYRPQSR